MNVLPFCKSAIIDTYSGVAGDVAALMADKKYIPLIVANHFSAVYYDILHSPGFNWVYYNDDYKIVEDLKEQVVNSNLIAEIKKSIDEGFYVQLYVDHYYIQKSSYYKKRHFLHDNATIYGYSVEKQIFVIGDNFIEGKYEIIEVPFDEVLRARKDDEKLPIQRFKLIDKYTFSMKVTDIKYMLKCYEEGKVYKNIGKVNENSIHLLNSSGIIYGMRIYEVLLNTINTNDYDPRPFHFMMNHMQLYTLILYIFDGYQVVYDKDRVYEMVEKLISETTKLRNLYLKYSISPKKNIMIKMVEKIDLLKKEEGELINILLSV